MLQLSTRARYALRAMIELACREDQGAVHLRDLADAQALPVDYLEQIALPLRKAGLIVGRRGPRGGYRLARPPGDMTAADIVEAVGGRIALTPCVDRPSVCPRAGDCVARGLWRRISEAIRASLCQTTLAQLRDQQRGSKGVRRRARRSRPGGTKVDRVARR